MSRFLKDSLPHLRERVSLVCLALPSSLRLNTHREHTFVCGQWAKAVSHSKYSSGFLGSCAASSCLPPRYLQGGVGVSSANWAGDVSSESANGEHVTQPQMNPVQPPRTEDAEPLRCRCCQRTKKNYTTSEKKLMQSGFKELCFLVRGENCLKWEFSFKPGCSQCMIGKQEALQGDLSAFTDTFLVAFSQNCIC